MATDDEELGLPVYLIKTERLSKGRGLISEGHLIYEMTNRASRWLPHLPLAVLQVGDLSITVDPLDFSFQGLELYTNPALWTNTQMEPPIPGATGILRFGVNGAEAMQFLEGEPRVEKLSKQWVRIALGSERGTVHGLCGEGLMVGISESGHLTDFWLSLDLSCS